VPPGQQHRRNERSLLRRNQLVEWLSADEKRALLAIIYYPRETYARAPVGEEESGRRAFLLATLAREIEILRELSRRYTLRQVEKAIPAGMLGLLRELGSARAVEGQAAFLEALVAPFVRHGREIELLRAVAHVIRSLLVFEIVVAGDLGDRGPRLDKVVELLMRQPRVRVVWGNIIPTISDVESYAEPRRVADTERGAEIEREIEALERLIRAYEDSVIQERPA
jgi:fructose-1,6-bisphosphatase